MTRQKVGIRMVIAAYAVLVYIALSAPFYAKAHPHLDPALLAQYASPWPVALGCSLALMGTMLAIVPLRQKRTASRSCFVKMYGFVLDSPNKSR